MKIIIFPFVLLVIDILLTTMIGITGLQEILSLLIYFFPIVIDIFLAIFYYNLNLKQIRFALLKLLFLLLGLTFILSCVIYFSPSFISSIIVLSIFVMVFHIFPIVLFLIISFFIEWRTVENKK